VSFQPGQVIEVTAGDVAQGGWCVARPEDAAVVFLRHALPGERVRARVTEVTSRFARADAIEILDPSRDRVPPPCPNARPGGCGGCDWQHASLPAQRALKATVLGDQLRRLAGIDWAGAVEPLPGDDGTQRPGGPPPGLGWRTRLQFAVREDGMAGLRAHRSHDVVDIGDCPIAHPAIRALGITRRRWRGAIGVEVLAGTGGEDDGDRPAQRAVIVTRASASGWREAQGPGRSEPPESLLTRKGGRLTPVRGRAYLTQRVAGRDWRVSAGSFWQVHPAAAGTLTAAVLAALEPKPGDSALDLYCGAGLFAGALAPAVGQDGAVIGVEYDTAAVRDARHNLREWPWARVRRGDVSAVLRRGLPATRLAVADPPRAGLAREVIDRLRAERFAYVSCDPATLARDIRLLTERGWTLEGLRAFDAFPMTHHMECVATLAR
jgi:tRNA/tmRNA/rRNA uracil-C5-methylase (TrmA/RlmC/RlmD family)